MSCCNSCVRVMTNYWSVVMVLALPVEVVCADARIGDASNAMPTAADASFVYIIVTLRVNEEIIAQGDFIEQKCDTCGVQKHPFLGVFD